MIDAIKELETFIKKETRLGSVSSIVEADGPGVNVFIDHESPETNESGNFVVIDMPIIMTIKDTIKNWEQVMKTCQIILKELRNQKGHKWRAGNIERIESVTDYILRLRLSAKVPLA